MFSFFEVHEWLTNSQKEGRIITALTYLKTFKEQFNPVLKTQFLELEKTVSKVTQAFIRELVKL